MPFQKDNKINLGRIWTKESREKARLSRLGWQATEETKQKISLVKMGNTNMLGKRFPEETKRKMSEAAKGNKNRLGKHHSGESIEKIRQAHKGYHFSEESKEKMRLAQLGEKSWSWKGGVSIENILLKKSGQYKQWRKAVYKRDNWTCQKCGYKGSNLNAHHIKHFIKHVEIRLDINNGITLCKDCHKEVHKRKVLIA